MPANAKSILLFYKIAREKIDRNIRGDTGGINASTSEPDRFLIHVRGEDPYFVLFVECRRVLCHQDRDGISLLARRATWHPDPDRSFLRCGRENGRNELFAQGFKSAAVAEKPRYTYEEVVSECRYFLRSLLKIFKILLDSLNSGNP